jgi:hypothetical protein
MKNIGGSNTNVNGSITSGVNLIFLVRVLYHDTSQFILSLLLLICVPSFELLKFATCFGNFLSSCDVVCTQ